MHMTSSRSFVLSQMLSASPAKNTPLDRVTYTEVWGIEASRATEFDLCDVASALRKIVSFVPRGCRDLRPV